MTIEDAIRANKYFTPTRLNSLYSDFENLKSLNPDGYEANIVAWSDLIGSLLKKGYFQPASSLSVPSTSPSLSHTLTIPVQGKPKAIGLVLNELVHRNELIPFSVFSASIETYYNVVNQQSSFVDYLSPKKWVSWGISHVGFKKEFNAARGGDLIPENYLQWNYLVEVGSKVQDALFRQATNYSSKLFDVHEFQNILEQQRDIPPLSSFDIEILLIFLSRDKKAIILKRDKDEVYIKLSQNNESEITQEDISIISLKRSINNAERYQEELESKISQVKAKVQQILHSKDKDDRSRILKLLQTKKMFMNYLEKCSSSLIQLQQVFLSLNNARDNISLAQVLEQSANVLKAFNGEVNQDKLDTILSDIDENIQITNEISDSVASGLDMGTIDEGDIEDELQRLEKEVQQQEQTSTPQNKSGSENQDLVNRLSDLKIKDSGIIEQGRNNNYDENMNTSISKDKENTSPRKELLTPVQL